LRWLAMYRVCARDALRSSDWHLPEWSPVEHVSLGLPPTLLSRTTAPTGSSMQTSDHVQQSGNCNFHAVGLACGTAGGVNSTSHRNGGMELICQHVVPLGKIQPSLSPVNLAAISFVVLRNSDITTSALKPGPNQY
jgi:hypothetical protein